MKIDRLIGIIMLLNNKGRITAGELAKKYEVSVKTIQRDMETINMAGVPIVSYRGQDGGYEILKSYRIDSSILTQKDVLLISALIDGLGKSYSFPLLTNLKEKFGVLGQEKSKGQRLAIDLSPWRDNTKTKEKLKIIDRSLAEGRMIEFHYTNLRGISGLRSVEPLQMVFKSFHWYLYGWCTEKAAYRFFKVRRMQDVRQGGVATEREMGTEECFESQPECLVEIKLRVTPDMLSRADDYFEAYTVEGDTLIIVWPLDEWVYSFILGLGSKAEVLAPLSLREAIKKRVRRMNELYQ